MMSNGKQFTVTHEMLTAVTSDQRWPDVVTGISAHLSKFAFVLFCYMTNHLITGPLGNSEFCFPLISMFPLTNIEILGKQNVVGFLQHFELESPSNCKVNSCDCTDEQ